MILVILLLSNICSTQQAATSKSNGFVVLGVSTAEPLQDEHVDLLRSRDAYEKTFAAQIILVPNANFLSCTWIVICSFKPMNKAVICIHVKMRLFQVKFK